MSTQVNLPTTLVGFTTGETDFRIPLYQRRYDWSEVHVQTLFADMQKSLVNGASHYFGTITLVKSVEGDYEVIDGQQRLTTLSLLFMALARKWDDKLAGDVFRNFCINPDTGLPRLSFENHWDQMAFHQVMLGRHCSLSQRENHILKNYKKLEELVEGLNLEDWTNRIHWEKLQLAKVELPSNLIPERVFRRMNGSKLELSFKDLVHNFLLMEARREDEQEVYSILKKLSNSEEYFSLISRAQNRGESGDLKSRYDNFRKAYESIARIGDIKNVLDFLKELERSWVMEFESYRAELRERLLRWDLANEWRLGPQLMRITIAGSIGKRESGGREMFKALILNSKEWLAAFRLSVKKFHRATADRNYGWAVAGHLNENPWDWESVEEELETKGCAATTAQVIHGIEGWLKQEKESRHYTNSGVIGLQEDWTLDELPKALELFDPKPDDEQNK